MRSTPASLWLSSKISNILHRENWCLDASFLDTTWSPKTLVLTPTIHPISGTFTFGNQDVHFMIKFRREMNPLRPERDLNGLEMAFVPGHEWNSAHGSKGGHQYNWKTMSKGPFCAEQELGSTGAATIEGRIYGDFWIMADIAFTKSIGQKVRQLAIFGCRSGLQPPNLQREFMIVPEPGVEAETGRNNNTIARHLPRAQFRIRQGITKDNHVRANHVRPLPPRTVPPKRHPASRPPPPSSKDEPYPPLPSSKTCTTWSKAAFRVDGTSVPLACQNKLRYPSFSEFEGTQRPSERGQ
jgi:hypothetical protein